MSIDTSKFKKRGIDVKGYWKAELGPITCIPRAIKLFDGNLNAQKPAIMIIVELCDECLAVVAKANEDEDDIEVVRTIAGDQVGVWYKPGMAAIKTLANEPCTIAYQRDAKGEIVTKKMKKPGMNPMKCFDVLSEKNPMKVIPVIEDSRKESANVNTPFAPAKGARQSPAPVSDNAAPVDDSDIPF